MKPLLWDCRDELEFETGMELYMCLENVPIMSWALKFPHPYPSAHPLLGYTP